MKCQIQIQNQNIIYEPSVEEGIDWTTERKGTPGKLTFNVIDDGLIHIEEGNPVKLLVDDKNVFYGYIFTIARDREKKIKLTCYDQLRYFKNKDTYVYSMKKASDVINMLCTDFKLAAGVIEDTEYVIAKKKESNKTLFDIAQNALDDTMMNIKKLYVLYDDFGNITLKNIASMRVPLIIDADTGQNFDYKTSIDSNTYNQVKLIKENSKTGARDVYMVKDSDTINQWGVLQYFDTLKDGEVGSEKATNLLNMYNAKTKNLSVKDAFGYIGLRAGCSPLVQLDLGDITVANFMVAEKVTHKFNNGIHTMDLTLIGGEFSA